MKFYVRVFRFASNTTTLPGKQIVNIFFSTFYCAEDFRHFLRGAKDMSAFGYLLKMSRRLSTLVNSSWEAADRETIFNSHFYPFAISLSNFCSLSDSQNLKYLRHRVGDSKTSAPYVNNKTWKVPIGKIYSNGTGVTITWIN